ncbi:MAG TPA: TIGR01777 family oxidoreductase [Coriobacteriia bacterium]|nr:TIGR01777 family oxidoreductase [Coriobacteriia bacterium]
MKVAIAGGNGFIGRELTRQLLERGDEVTWLSHRAGRVAPPTGVAEVAFDPATPDAEWAGAVAASDAVVNLSGYPIASRWDEHVKYLLVSSRVETTRALIEAIGRAREAGHAPSVYVSASGIGIFGDAGDTVLVETAAPGEDWLAQLAVLWEREAARAEAVSCRTVMVRTGLVLGDEGLVPRLKLPMLLFTGGPIGTGKQWVSWIHHADIAGIYVEALHNAALTGPVNAAAPKPVVMDDFIRAFGQVLRRPAWFRVPDFALKIVLGEVAPYTLYSQRVSAAKALDAGYVFRYPEVEGALRDVLR